MRSFCVKLQELMTMMITTMLIMKCFKFRMQFFVLQARIQLQSMLKWTVS